MSSFKNGAVLVKDVFDEKTFKLLDEESCRLLDSPHTEYRVNKANWTATSPHISNYGQAGTIITTHVDETCRSLMLAAIAKHTEFDFDDNHARFTYNYMFRGAFIPWHSDPHCDIACTFYFQDTDLDHGGLYLYSQVHDGDFYNVEDKQIIAVPPRRNSMLLQHEIWHTVTPLTPMTPVRRSIQAFLNFAR